MYRHIVLAVHHLPSGRFGALGLSRRDALMYKPLRFSSLAELVADFKAGYEAWWHALLKVGRRAEGAGRRARGAACRRRRRCRAKAGLRKPGQLGGASRPTPAEASGRRRALLLASAAAAAGLGSGACRQHAREAPTTPPPQVRVGLPVEHDLAHPGHVCWRFCNISLARHSWETACQALNTHAGQPPLAAACRQRMGPAPQRLQQLAHSSASKRMA
jgi:hypothetical protein